MGVACASQNRVFPALKLTTPHHTPHPAARFVTAVWAAAVPLGVGFAAVTLLLMLYRRRKAIREAALRSQVEFVSARYFGGSEPSTGECMQKQIHGCTEVSYGIEYGVEWYCSIVHGRSTRVREAPSEAQSACTMLIHYLLK